jgi:hypothetical protein
MLFGLGYDLGFVMLSESTALRFVCSITTCWYVAMEFFKMSPDDPVHYVLLKDRTIRCVLPPSLHLCLGKTCASKMIKQLLTVSCMVMTNLD